MIAERAVDCGDLYRRQRLDLLEVVRSLPHGRAAATVPATPAWSVHDVVAHLVGITADLNAGRFGDGDADGWTARQVAGRTAHTLDELVTEWEGEACAFEGGLRLFGFEVGCHFVGDLVQHSLDVREAFGAAAITDETALLVALDHYLGAFHDALVRQDAGSVAVTAGGERWRVGRGPQVAGVNAPPAALLRSLGGRDLAPRWGALQWEGDADGVLQLMDVYGEPEK